MPATFLNCIFLNCIYISCNFNLFIILIGFNKTVLYVQFVCSVPGCPGLRLYHSLVHICFCFILTFLSINAGQNVHLRTLIILCNFNNIVVDVVVAYCDEISCNWCKINPPQETGNFISTGINSEVKPEPKPVKD